MMTSALKSSSVLVLSKAKTLPPKVSWQFGFIVCCFLKCMLNTLYRIESSTVVFIFESDEGFFTLKHMLWLFAAARRKGVILFGQISLKIGSLQQFLKWILTVFDQCNACRNSGGLTGKCVSCVLFWGHLSVYPKGQKWEEGGMTSFAQIIASAYHSLRVSWRWARWACWLVSSSCAGLPTQ